MQIEEVDRRQKRQIEEVDRRGRTFGEVGAGRTAGALSLKARQAFSLAGGALGLGLVYL